MNSCELWELVMDRVSWHGCSPWDLKESDTTERLNWTEWIFNLQVTKWGYKFKSDPKAPLSVTEYYTAG